MPRISFPGFTDPCPVAPRLPRTGDDRLDATRLTLRLRALAAALDDLPAQAQRFARWKARSAGAQDGKRDAAGALKGKRRSSRVSPLRRGRPPGGRRRPRHEVDHLLNELHGLAREVLEQPDTS